MKRIRACFAQPKPAALPCLTTFFALSWLHMLALSWPLFNLGVPRLGANLATMFHVAAWPLYSLLYLLPALALTLGARRLLPLSRLAQAATALLVTTATLLLARMDGMIYDLYAFHINSFVLNLVLTPGGIDSLGAGSSGILSFLALTLRVLLVQGILLLGAWGYQQWRGCWTPHYWRMGALLGGLFLVQGTVYGISDVANYGPVLEGSRVYPLFQRVRFRSLAERLGFERNSRSELFAAVESDAPVYPRAPVEFAAVTQAPNIVLLVAESLRWDQLTPETMPATWALAARGQHFTQHYSSGNGTREALFGLFYGLYGSYWGSFMHAGQQPLLMQRVQELGYALDLRTSAAFTYPEFDRTLFASIPAEQLQVADAKLDAWRRDELNTKALQDFLLTRDHTRPFFSFFFLESTHAPYSFPADTALVSDYQNDVDYTELSRQELAANIKPLYNRYRNAAHWVDLQLQQIYTTLEQQGLLENTIVIITGDHGEEFMEKGAWGHNSTFVEEQTRVPLVMLMPGLPPARHEGLSSHLDLGTTLLRELGAPADTSSYSLGRHILDAVPRDHVVISDWHSIALVTAQLKYRIPYLMTAGANQWSATDQADRAVGTEQEAQLLTQHRGLLLQAMANCTVFSAHQGRALTDAR
jgi:membrane-anchored protein YejM (alkaline phosphatase superfamily)